MDNGKSLLRKIDPKIEALLDKWFKEKALGGHCKTHMIMTKVRAKFVCDSIEDQPEYEQKNVSFSAVIDDSEENKSFAKFTPSGILQMVISYETPASNAFEVGKEYYLDFTLNEE